MFLFIRTKGQCVLLVAQTIFTLCYFKSCCSMLMPEGKMVTYKIQCMFSLNQYINENITIIKQQIDQITDL